MKNNRRKFFKSIGLVAAGAVVTGLHSKKSKASDKIKWKMVTSWPKNFPGLGAGAETLARYINKLSGGSLTVKVFGAGELVPPYFRWEIIQCDYRSRVHIAMINMCKNSFIYQVLT